jgi:hypothetical protein
MAARINYSVMQGSTFKDTLRYESSEIVYKLITGIAKSAPVLITAAGHNIPEGWRFKVSGAGGMKEINDEDVYHRAHIVDVDTIAINNINSLNYGLYTSGGVIEYFKPIDLTGMTARMQIRLRIDSTDVIHELTTENGGITLDTVTCTINLKIPASVTSTFDFSTAVYNLELIDSLGDVVSLSRGILTLVKEVTR